MGKPLDLAGRKFGRWRVLHPERCRRGNILWRCLCSCGTERLVVGSSLHRGLSASCGCLAREKFIKRVTTHGMSYSRAYQAWANMKQRCLNARHPLYRDYSGRGICDDWRGRHDFVNCYADMGDPPPGMSIHRIDNDGPYAPWNCIWADAKTQAASRRRPKKKIKTKRPRVGGHRGAADDLAMPPF